MRPLNTVGEIISARIENGLRSRGPEAIPFDRVTLPSFDAIRLRRTSVIRVALKSDSYDLCSG
jgi:hypothetical protein